MKYLTLILLLLSSLCFSQQEERDYGVTKQFAKRINESIRRGWKADLKDLHLVKSGLIDSTSSKYLYTLRGLSYYHLDKGRNDSASYYAKRGQRLSKKNSKLYYKILFPYMDAMALQSSNPDKALKEFNQLKKKYKDSDLIIAAYPFIDAAKIYRNKGDYTSCIQDLESAILIGKRLKSEDFLSAATYNLANTYHLMGEFNKAHQVYDEKYKIDSIQKNKKEMIDYFGKKAGLYAKQFNRTKAIEYINKKLDLEGKKENNNVSYEISENGDLIRKVSFEHGKDYLFEEESINQLYEPTQLFEEKETEALKTSNLEQLEAVYLAQYEFNKDKNQKKAEEYFTKYQEISAELRKSEVEKQIQIAKIDQQQKELLLVKEKNHYQSLASQQNKILAFALGALLLLVLGASFLYLKNIYIRSNLKQVHLEQKLMRSQMNPHFIFNSLSSIQTLILQNKNNQAISYLSKFSKLVRAILENSLHNFVPLEDEIKALEHYLSLQKARFRYDLEYEINLPIEDDLENISIPPMLIQPFVENAIEHGLRKKEDGGKIFLQFKKAGKLLHCVIEDNGVGLEASKDVMNKEKQSVSTSIIRERLQILGKQLKSETYLAISNRKTGGTIVKMGIAIKETAA